MTTEKVIDSYCPPEQEILRLISKKNGKYGKKDIAKYFDLNDAQKEHLKVVLKTLKKSDLVFKGKGNVYYINKHGDNLNVIGTVHSLVQNEGYIIRLECGKEVIAFSLRNIRNPLSLVKGSP